MWRTLPNRRPRPPPAMSPKRVRNTSSCVDPIPIPELLPMWRTLPNRRPRPPPAMSPKRVRNTSPFPDPIPIPDNKAGKAIPQALQELLPMWGTLLNRSPRPPPAVMSQKRALLPARLRAAGYRIPLEMRRSVHAAVANLPVGHKPTLTSFFGTR